VRGYENIAGLRFRITNHGSEVLRDVHVGLLADLDVRRRADRSGHVNDLPYQANFFSRFHDDCQWRLGRSVTVLREGGTGGNAGTGVTGMSAGGQLLTIEQTVDRSQVQPGEHLTYRVVLNNLINYPLPFNFSVVHTLPPGFTYVSGSARLDGNAAPEPAIQLRTLAFSFSGIGMWTDVNGDLTPQPCEPGHRTLTYQLKVSPEAVAGDFLHAAVACSGAVRTPVTGHVTTSVSVVTRSSGMPLITVVPVDRTTDPLQRVHAGVPLRTTLFERNRVPGQGGLPRNDAERYAAMAGTYPGSAGSEPSDYVVLVSQGPYASLGPGESMLFDAAVVAADDAEGLFDAVSNVMDLHPTSTWIDPGAAPPAPDLRVTPLDHAVRLEWDNRPEVLIGAGLSGPDGTRFAGYNVYKLADWRRRESMLPPRENWSLLASVGPNAGLGQIPLSAVTDSSLDYERILYEQRLYPRGRYRLTDTLVKNGFDYVYGITTVSEVRSGSVLTGILESPLTVQFVDRVTPQAAARNAGGGVWVVPNPFRANAGWDRPPVLGDALTRHIDFMGLPRAQSTIKIFTVSGDLVAVLDHDGTQGDGEAEWNLVSRNGQDVESGVYLFTVDSPLGHQVGRFVIIR
jgi:uncharacterized repeat protein (TIGR01451 family)